MTGSHRFIQRPEAYIRCAEGKTGLHVVRMWLRMFNSERHGVWHDWIRIEWKTVI